jgi:hypothetical protein
LKLPTERNQAGLSSIARGVDNVRRPADTPRYQMSGFLFFLIFMALYFALQFFILPKLGVPT